MLGGFRGIFYRRRFFDDGVFSKMDELLEDGPFLADDHFFASCLRTNGIRSMVVSTDHVFEKGMLNDGVLSLGDGVYDDVNKDATDESYRRLKEKEEEWSRKR